ncbi:hypothetical protein Bhyg_08213 [Pseudolycoriella hygida]|uniref:Uncharacterized protein n=1 Tax=Pseudolycoriella hygida TaxID=35572 RepID=A0A9Q0S4K8_9DIPT|nr:hypothetical protein Bhyg_08213 [Pseudolycoriella hygida]
MKIALRDVNKFLLVEFLYTNKDFEFLGYERFKLIHKNGYWSSVANSNDTLDMSLDEAVYCFQYVFQF